MNNISSGRSVRKTLFPVCLFGMPSVLAFPKSERLPGGGVSSRLWNCGKLNAAAAGVVLWIIIAMGVSSHTGQVG